MDQTMLSIRHSFFDHAAQVQARLRIAECFPYREDIHEHAKTLIDLQDGHIGPSGIRLDYEERVWGRYIGRVIGNPEWPEDEQPPVGSKLPPLFFSPLFQFDRALRQRSAASVVAITLPKTVQQLEDWLNEEMEGVFFGGDRFEKTTGVTINAVARFLFTTRTLHPALFLLLLSFEIDQAMRTMPCLDKMGGRNEASQWREAYFEKAKCSILAVFEIIRILRRGTAIIKALSVKRHFTVSEVRRLAARLRSGSRTSGDRDTLEAIGISTYGLRKIVLTDIDRHHAMRGKPGHRTFRRRATDEHTLLSMIACLDGPDAAYAVDVAGDFTDDTAKNLPSARPPPQVAPKHSAIPVERINGAGQKQNEQLFTFYGLTGRDVAILVAIEVGAALGKRKFGRPEAAMANAILDALWAGQSEVRSRNVDPMSKAMQLAFPAKGDFRHSCGFARSSWTDLEADAAQWRILAEARNVANVGDVYAELFLATRRYLQGFSHGVSRLADLQQAARIFCHLSHAMGPLAQDPVWIRLFDRAKFMAAINVKDETPNTDRTAKFGHGPRNLEQLVRSIG